MRILRIRINGLSLYKEDFDISFYAVQRIESSHLDSLSKLFGNIYVNNVEAFAGINASGKTMALKVIAFTSILLGAVPLNSSYVPQILNEDEKATFDVDFYNEGIIYHLTSELIKTKKWIGITEDISFQKNYGRKKPIQKLISRICYIIIIMNQPEFEIILMSTYQMM